MRLLKCNNAGGFVFIYFNGAYISLYVILLYTWGLKKVTFKDLINRTGLTKYGYNKIRFCGKQVIRDSLEHFWVDICCINKFSSAELIKAINFIFY